jgi:hypothetical protein
MRLALGLPILFLAVAGAFGCSDDPAPDVTQDSGVIGDQDASETSDSGGGGGDAGQPPADAGDSGVLDLCDPVAQTGCDTPPNVKCVIEPDAQNPGAHCVPEGDDQMLGDACMGEDCEAGLVCARITSTSSVSECKQICNIVDGTGCEALGAEFDCRLTITGTNWGACLELPPICNPLTQDPCPQDQACSTFTRRSGLRELRCREAGPQMDGQTCGSSNSGLQCARGLVCIRDPDLNTAICREFCDTNDDCASPATCTGVVNDPPFMFCAE